MRKGAGTWIIRMYTNHMDLPQAFSVNTDPY